LGASALPEQRLDNGRAAGTNATPVAEKARVYVLPLYAESAPCNRKSHPACMRGGQSANTLQTTGAGVTPSTIPGNRAEVGKMPALKGSRKCDPTHRKRQLTSYADRFDELWRAAGGQVSSVRVGHGTDGSGVHAARTHVKVLSYIFLQTTCKHRL